MNGWRDEQTDHRDDIHALEDLAKDNVLPIQPRGYGSGDELERHPSVSNEAHEERSHTN